MDENTFYQELLDLIGNSMSTINHNLIAIRKDITDLTIGQVGHTHRLTSLELSKKERTKTIIGTWIALVGALGAIIASAIQSLKK